MLPEHTKGPQLGRIAALGAELDKLIEDQKIWSVATFGSDTDRGPQGPLQHDLALEILSKCYPNKEYNDTIKKSWEKRLKMTKNGENQSITDKMECADLLILLLDCTRRAGNPHRLNLQCPRGTKIKMKINKARKWRSRPRFHQTHRTHQRKKGRPMINEGK